VEKRTVAWLLENAGSLDNWAVVCLPPRRELRLDDMCAVVDGRDLSPEEDVPRECLQLGLTTVLSPEAVEMVVGNLSQQKANADDNLKLRALNHFRTHDAYIDLSSDFLDWQAVDRDSRVELSRARPKTHVEDAVVTPAGDTQRLPIACL
jgi:hypothetical protein